jgi:hypothetical protein
MSTSRSQIFTGQGNYTFDVPANVSLVFVSMIGGGGAGSDVISGVTAGGGAGGSAEYAFRLPYHVTPGGTVSITVGAHGTHSVNIQPSPFPVPPVSTFSGIGSFRCMGGGNGYTQAGEGGAGGGIRGAVTVSTTTINSPNFEGFGLLGLYELAGFTGGAGGSPGGINYFGAGATIHGGPCINYSPGLVTSGKAIGGNGASSPYGPGGQGGATEHGNAVPGNTGYFGAGGGGGGGGTTGSSPSTGANGIDGMVLVQWIE